MGRREEDGGLLGSRKYKQAISPEGDLFTLPIPLAVTLVSIMATACQFSANMMLARLGWIVVLKSGLLREMD